MTARTKKTPVRLSLKSSSALMEKVEDGIGAVKASDRQCLADTEKARRRLDQSGIQFVGTKVLAKHFPAGKMLGKGPRR